jgi:hypothetical protein
MRKAPAILVTITLIAWLAAYMGVPAFGDDYWFLLDAIGKFTLSVAVACVIVGYYAQVIANSMAVLAASNLLDEIFFNPQSTGWNEYVFTALVLIYASIKIGFRYGKST